MSRSKSNRGGKRGGGGGGHVDIISTESMLSRREGSRAEVDESLSAFQEVFDQYGQIVDDIQVAKIGAKDLAVMAYYDGANVAVNDRYFNTRAMNAAYDNSVNSGFHPSRGNKTGMQAVVYHELGHKLTDDYGKKLGYNYSQLDQVAKIICEKARKNTTSRGVVIMASKISGYAQKSNAECVAEAFADVCCNGSRAKAESRAIVNELNRVLKK